MTTEYKEIYNTVNISASRIAQAIHVDPTKNITPTDNSLVKWDDVFNYVQDTDIIVDDSNNMTIPTGSDITFTGTGAIVFTDTTNNRELKLQGPTGVSANYSIILPSTTGLNGYVLTLQSITNNDGILYWTKNVGGSVFGPASSVDNTIIRWSGTNGSVLQNSEIVIDDSDNIAIPTGSSIIFPATGGGFAFTEDAGANTVTLKGPATILSSYGITLPSLTGTVNFVLAANPNGDDTELTWVAQSGVTGPTANTADNSVVRWDGSAGFTTQGSNLMIDDDDDLHIPTGVNFIFNGTGGGVTFTESGGANTTTLLGPRSITSNYGIVFPSTTGIPGRILKVASLENSDTDAVLGWVENVGVTGPTSSTSYAIAKWGDSNGDTILNTSVIIDDAGGLAIPTGSNLQFNGVGGGLVFSEDDPGANTVTLQGPNSISTDYGIIFPSAIGVGGNILKATSLDGTNVVMGWTANEGVTGPSSSTDNAIARWDTNSSTIQNSGVTIDDNNNLVVPAGSTVTFNGTGGAVVFKESSRVNSVSLKGAGSITSNYSFILPSTTGIPGTSDTLKVSGFSGSDAVLVWGENVGVTGPSSSTNNAIVRWNGSSGDAVQNSSITIDDSNNVSVQSNRNIQFNGTGGGIAFTEDGAATNDTVTIKGPESIPSNWTLVLPASTGLEGYVLKVTDVSGTEATLSWSEDFGVTGPASSTNNAAVKWNGTLGDTTQNSGIVIDDNNNLTTPSSGDLIFGDVGGLGFKENAGANVINVKGPTSVTNTYRLELPPTTGALNKILAIDSVAGSDTVLDWITDNRIAGPVSSTDNGIARWNGSGGQTLQNSSVTISDADLLTTRHVLPSTNNTYNCGTGAARWANTYTTNFFGAIRTADHPLVTQLGDVAGTVNFDCDITFNSDGTRDWGVYNDASEYTRANNLYVGRSPTGLLYDDIPLIVYDDTFAVTAATMTGYSEAVAIIAANPSVSTTKYPSLGIAADYASLKFAATGTSYSPFPGRKGVGTLQYNSSQLVIQVDSDNDSWITDTGGEIYLPNIPNTSTSNTLWSNTPGSSGEIRYVVSSRRYKDNIQKLFYDMKDLDSMEVKSFNYKKDGHFDFGLIAEEVPEFLQSKARYDALKDSEYAPEGDFNDDDLIPNGVDYQKVNMMALDLAKRIRKNNKGLWNDIYDIKKLLST